MKQHQLIFEQVSRAPGMWLRECSYSAATAFVLGYDAACEGGTLRGFSEWLHLRLGKRSSLHWTELVLEVSLGPEYGPVSEEENRKAIDALFILISEFDVAIDTKRKMEDIFEEHRSRFGSRS